MICLTTDSFRTLTMSRFATDMLANHTVALTLLGTLSVALLAVSVFAAPWLIEKLPVDYFGEERSPNRNPGSLRVALMILRNVAGAIFILLGLVMLVTPGPGLVALLLGLALCQFPGRHALVCRLAAQPRVFESLNWIRRRRGMPPFHQPERH